MQRISNKEYILTAELMRDFLEERELISYSDLPSITSIVKELKCQNYLENGITSRQLGCEAENEIVVFVHFDETRPLEELFKIMTSAPLEKGEPMECYIVIFVRTMEAKQRVDSSKSQISALAKIWLKDRTPERTKSKIHFCTLHASTQEEKNFPIAINSRIQSLHYSPKSQEATRIASDVYVANLYDIVNLYNRTGTELFERNVRYHIRDDLNVESEIQRTLTHHPADFFNSNNGIAIQIKHRENLDRRNERDIRLTYCEKGDLSVINGAQTISAAADFFFRQGTDFEDGKSIPQVIEHAKKEAWVLLRIFYPADGNQEDCLPAFDHISISLNRQKPISPMDVEYSCPEVMLINSLYEKSKGSPYYFKLLKRGQEEPGRFQYQLSDFGRMVTAYYHNNPGTARSGSTQDIIRCTPEDYDETEGTKQADTKSIYAPFTDSEDPQALFMVWYRPLNFANEIAKMYNQVWKQYRSKKEDCDTNILTVLGNGRYFFVAYLINMLNGSLVPPQKGRSFAAFDYEADQVKPAESELRVLIEQYASFVAKFALTYLKKHNQERALNSNDFKSRAFYQAWCEHARRSQTILRWNKDIQAALQSSAVPADSVFQDIWDSVALI